MSETLRKNYNSLDLAKFVCAVMIICAHFAAEWGHFPAKIDYLFSVYIIAVPFFFTCSGFLFFIKLNRTDKAEHKGVFLKYIKRVLIMYAAWSLIYFMFILAHWINVGTSVKSVSNYLYRSLVFSTYATIWFLPALVVAVAIVYFLSRKISLKTIFAISLVFYVIGSLGYSYSFVSDKVPFLQKIFSVYLDAFVTTRNGLFNGFPFVALGALIASRKERINIKTSFSMSLVCLVLVTAEAVLLKIVFHNTGADTVFFLIPFTFFFFEFTLALDLKGRKIFKTFRNISLLMFVSQRLFLTALPSVMPKVVMETICANSYIGMVIIVGTTIVFSLIIIKLSEKIKVLKVLY